MLRIALTGGIASGKSSVVSQFKALDIAIVDADAIARQLVQPGQPLLDELVNAFGNSILTADGALNRPQMRQRIFNDAHEKLRLEHILHPAIYQQIEQELAKLSHLPYVIIDIPLLAENNAAQRFDRVLVIDCPVETQLQRLLKRDGIDQTLAEQIINSQATRQQRLALADDILDNSQSLERLAEHVKSLHNFYLSLASARTRPA